MNFDWVSLVQTVGVPIAMLVFVGWGLVQAARWTAPRLDRMADRVFAGVEEVRKYEVRIAEMEARIEALWEFHVRRGAVEAVKQGVATMNSPVIVNDDASRWLAWLANDLRSFYRQLGRLMTEAQLAEEIEKRWGKEIVEKVCIPHGLSQGACLLIAIHVAKEPAAEDAPPPGSP